MPERPDLCAAEALISQVRKAQWMLRFLQYGTELIGYAHKVSNGQTRFRRKLC
jgi:hypothetical protein